MTSFQAEEEDFDFKSDYSSNAIKISLPDAERAFLENNLLLLAGKFEIDQKKALILQARLYPNPNVFLEQNIFNDRTDRYFDTTRNGQSVVQIQQLFLLGGKIDKRIKVAEFNKKISEDQFFDILRALKLELRNNFFQLYYLRQELEFYEMSVRPLRRTVNSLEKAYEARAILLAEVLRLKALLFAIENEKTEIINKIKEKESNLRVLLNQDRLKEREIDPIIDELQIDNIPVEQVKYEKLIELSYENRPDLKIALSSLKLEEANLELQKANALPDLSFGPVYNRAGTYIPNYWGVTAQFNVPIFDRNQGNIEASERAIYQRKVELQNLRLTVENDILVRLKKAQEKNRLYQEFKNKFTDEYKKLALLMISNYEKRYLTILEFADFYEAYRSTIVQLLNLQKDRIESIESINYAVGTTILDIKGNTQ